MPTLPIAAGIGVEGIIWLIILIFWGIAQAIQKSRRGTPGSPPRRTPSPLDDDIREMLEQLAGRPASKPTQAPGKDILLEDEEDEDAAPSLPPPPVRQQRPPPVRAAPPRPPIQPAPQSAYRRPPTPVAKPPFVIPALADIAPIITADEYAAASLSARSGLNAPGLSMRMKGMSLQGMATMPSGSLARHHGSPLLDVQELRNQASLRKAVLAKMILDPPRGLVPYGREAAP